MTEQWLNPAEQKISRELNEDMRVNWESSEPVVLGTNQQQRPGNVSEDQNLPLHTATTPAWGIADRIMKDESSDDKNNDSGVSPGHYASNSGSPRSRRSSSTANCSLSPGSANSQDSNTMQCGDAFDYSPQGVYKECSSPDEFAQHHNMEEQGDQSLTMVSSTVKPNEEDEISQDTMQCPLCAFTALNRLKFSEHLATHCTNKCESNEFVNAVLSQLSGQVSSPEEPSRASPTQGERSEHESEEADEPGLRIPRMNSQGKVKTFRCKQCNFVAITKLEFWEHSRGHIKAEKLLTCPKCPFVTEYKHHLEYHLRNHFGSKPFKCDKCTYSCVNKSMLNSHLKSHSNIYQYRCANCSYATKYCHSLKLHLRKYSHQPAMVLNADGSPNPLPIIDVYGTRRGPKQKPVKNDENSQNAGMINNNVQPILPTTPMVATPQMSPLNRFPANSVKNLAESINCMNGVNGMNLNTMNGFNGMNGMNGMNGLSVMNNINNLNNIAAMNGMNAAINTMNGMNGMNGINAVNGMNGINGINSLNGINGINIPTTNGVQIDAVQNNVVPFAYNHPMFAGYQMPINRFPVNEDAMEKLKANVLIEFAKAMDTSEPKSSDEYSPTSELSMKYNGSGSSSNFANTVNNLSNGQYNDLAKRKTDNENRMDSPARSLTVNDLESVVVNESGVTPLDLSKPETSGTVVEHQHQQQQQQQQQQQHQQRPVAQQQYLQPSTSGSATSGSPKVTGTSRRKGRAVKLERRMIAEDSDDESQRPKPPNDEAVVASPVATTSSAAVAGESTSDNSGSSETNGSSANSDNNKEASFGSVGMSNEFTCQYCEIAFGNVVMYTVHMGYHGYKDPYTCNMCGHECTDKVSFFLHIARSKHS